MTDSDIDEFSFLAAQAADARIESPLPRGERLRLDLPDGRVLSALKWSPSSRRSGAEAPVVTLLHGAGLNAHTWDTTILALGLPALAIDLPGHGDSSWRDDAAYVGRVLAPDVAMAMDAWTEAPQLLVGQSLGALTAAAVAASRPDLVRELVLIDITPGIDPNAGPTQIREFFAGPTDWASRDELVERALAFGLGGSRTATERGVFLNSRVRADGRVEWKHHFAHLAAAAGNAAATSEALSATPDAASATPDARTATPDAASATPDAVSAAPDAVSAAPDAVSADSGGDAVGAVLADTGWDDLAAVAAPVTLVRGDHGYVTEADATQFARRLPEASVVTVASGHNVQEELPVDLGRRLREIAGKA